MALQKYIVETRHWGACSVLYAVARAGDSVLNLISACQSDDWEGIFVALETSSSMYLRIISLNHSYLQLVTPLWPPIPLQSHILLTHPHPIAIHTHQPHTSLQPHTTQNHPHPSNCPHPSATHTLQPHTYPPTTHTWCQSILYKWIHWNKITQRYLKSINVNNCVVVKLNVLFTYLFTDHTLAQDV